MTFKLRPEVLDAVLAGQRRLLEARIEEYEIEDFLSGCLQYPKGMVNRALRQAGVDLDGLRADVTREVASVDEGAGAAAMPTSASEESAPRTQYSARSMRFFERAAEIAQQSSDDGTISEAAIILVINEWQDKGLTTLFRKHGLDPRRFANAVELMTLTPDVDPDAPLPYDIFAQYTNALSPRLRPYMNRRVVGREDEVRQAVGVLKQAYANNVVLVGEPGVGKTAVAHGLANRIASAEKGDPMYFKSVFGLNVPAMYDGVTHRCEYTGRHKRVLEVARQSGGDIVLFVGSMRDYFDASSGAANPRISRDLVSLLSDATTQIVGTATPDEFQTIIQGDPVLDRTFTPVVVEEPDVETAIEVLKAIRPNYERYHEVKFPDDALRAAVELSEKHIPDRNQPEKAVDLMDGAMALKRPDATSADADPPVVDADDIRRLVEKRYGKSKDPKDREFLGDGIPLADIAARLRRRVVGQDPAIARVVDTLAINRARLSSNNGPIGTFLFMGPSGVGKTELAKALAETLTGADENLIQLDMSEITSRADVSRLTGGSPNYVGYEEGGQLTNAVMKNPRCVILLDEIEKAHPRVFDLLLQVLEAGRLTDGQGRVVDFSQTLIIMTSNLGSGAPVDLGAFAAASSTGERRLPPQYDRAIRWHFRPEFINRIGDIVVFQPLFREALSTIIDIESNRLRSKLADRGIDFEMKSCARDLLLELPRDAMYGARPIQRAFANHVELAVARLIVDDGVVRGSTLIVDAIGGELTVSVDLGSVPPWTLL